MDRPYIECSLRHVDSPTTVQNSRAASNFVWWRQIFVDPLCVRLLTLRILTGLLIFGKFMHFWFSMLCPGVGRVYVWLINQIEFAVLNLMKMLSLSLSARPELWYATERRKGTNRECKWSTVLLAEKLRNVMVSTAVCSLPQTEHIFVA